MILRARQPKDEDFKEGEFTVVFDEKWEGLVELSYQVGHMKKLKTGEFKIVINEEKLFEKFLLKNLIEANKSTKKRYKK